MGFRSGLLDSVDKPGRDDRHFSGLRDFATLPDGTVVALDCRASRFRFQVFTSMALRTAWISVAAYWQCSY